MGMKTPAQDQSASALGRTTVLPHAVESGPSATLPDSAPMPALPADRHLEYLSRTALEFVSLPPGVDLYRHVATRLQALLGEAIVVVASYEPQTHELCQRAVVGAGHWLETLAFMTGRNLLGFRSVLNPEAEREMLLGRLVRVQEGLYEALLRSVPRALTRSIERLTGIHAIYGMGCCANGKCFGSILMLQRSKNGMPPAEVVEAFVGQAALAFQKQRAESDLRRSQQRFCTLMEQAPDACLILDRDGVIRDINPSGCRALGYPRDALLGRPIVEFLESGELAIKPFRLERQDSGDPLRDTRRIRRADGTYAVFESQMASLADGQILLVARDVSERRRLERDVAEASRREREAIGRDLHDSLGQHLAGLSCLCAALGQRLASRGASEAAEAERIARLLGDAVGQARRIAHGLYLADVTSEGVSAALGSLAEHLSSVFDVKCEYTDDGQVNLPWDATVANLYLIAQEAASNAVRHGRADTVTIELRADAAQGRLLIRDNGCGFEPQATNGDGMGLRIMKYRAGLMDGALEIASTPDGTTVQCTFPRRDLAGPAPGAGALPATQPA